MNDMNDMSDMSDTRNSNYMLNTETSSNYDYMGLFILIAMLLKACAQIPLIIKITQTKSAEDISIIMPIMFLAAFSILGAISLKRKLYFPLLIFSIGIATSIILLVQISMYEKSKDTSSSSQDSSGATPSDQTNEFKFPDPKSVYNNK
jgi:uncharacterized protein with PQ loop repeat